MAVSEFAGSAKEVTGVVLESIPCPNECPQGDAVLFVAKDVLHRLPGEFPVVQCKSCGLIRTNPRPTPASMDFYYPADYGPHLDTRVDESAPAKKSWMRRLAGSFYRSLIRYNTEALPSLRPGRMLEIGCASGAFMAKKAREGWGVEGIEFSELSARNAIEAGFKVHVGNLESAPDPAATFDLIVGWMVLEHLHDPVKVLKKLAHWMRPNGILAFSVPNAGALEFMLFKQEGYALQVPTHLYHYTPETLTAMLGRCGWRVERIFHQRVLTNLLMGLSNVMESKRAPMWMINSLRSCRHWSSAVQIMFYPLACLLAAIGQTGRMTVWARVDNQSIQES